MTSLDCQRLTRGDRKRGGFGLTGYTPGLRTETSVGEFVHVLSVHETALWSSARDQLFRSGSPTVARQAQPVRFARAPISAGPSDEVRAFADGSDLLDCRERIFELD